MSYIVPEKRAALDPSIDQLIIELVNQEKDDEYNNMESNINYVITKMLYTLYGDSYKEINDVVGLLHCISMEYYRTRAAPYEDLERERNGDVEITNRSVVIDEVVVQNDQR